MIGKRAPRRATGDSSFRRLTNYLLREGTPGSERVRHVRATNCGFDDVELALKAIEATQALNTRSQVDKTYHLILSFRAEDTKKLTPDVLLDVEETAARAIGLGEHQRLSVVHEDTDNVHVHLAINKIHPTTLRAIEPLRDFFALDAACAELEERHDLARDNRVRSHGRRDRPPIPTAARDMAAHRDEQTFPEWIADRRADIRAAATAAGSWEDLHRALASFDLAIRPRGAGMVIAARAERAATIKASTVSRNLALAALVDRFADYEPPSPDVLAIPAETAYLPTAADRARASPLWDRYNAEREEAIQSRQSAFARIRGDREREIERLRAHFAERRQSVARNRIMSGRQKFEVYKTLSAQRRAAYAATRARCKTALATAAEDALLPTWQDWLLNLAVAGDEQALVALRRTRRQSRRGAESFAIEADGSPPVSWPTGRSPETIRPNGDALYRLEDGGHLRDTDDQVRLSATDPASVAAAIDFARRKWPGRPLALAGDATFRRTVAAVAGNARLDVTFQDTTLERQRSILASLASSDREDNQAILDWIASRNATRERTADTAPYRPHRAGKSARGLYRGIRRIADGLAVALVLVDDELVVLRVSARQAAGYRRHRRSTPVRIDGLGRCEFDRTPARERDSP